MSRYALGRLVPTDVRQYLTSYWPALADDRHADQIRELALGYAPQTRNEAGVVAAALSGLHYWATQVGRPTEPAWLLRADVLDDYLQQVPLSPNTRYRQRSMLRRVAASAGLPSEEGRTGLRPRRSNPYTQDEVSAALVWATLQPRPHHRHSTLALLALTLGAGLTPADLLIVRGNHVQRDSAGRVFVTIAHESARQAPVLPRYASLVEECAARAGDRWLVKPAAVPPPNPRSNEFTRAIFRGAQPPPPGQPLPNTHRARATWLATRREQATDSGVVERSR